MADKVALNTASADALDRMADTGRDRAERIVCERERRGGFRRAGGLDGIEGFGDDAIRNLEQVSV